MVNTGMFSYCENLPLFVSNHPFKFLGRRPVREYFTSFFFNGNSNGQVDVMHNRASSGDQVSRVTCYKHFFTKCSRIVIYHHRRQDHHSKSLFYAKVGSGGNFESGNQVYGRRE